MLHRHDLTSQALRFVSRRRQGGRDRRGNIAYLVYLAALVLGFYGGPYIAAAVQLAGPNTGSDTAHRMAAALPTGLPTLLLAGYLLAGRDALWRGPVSPSAAVVDWLLPAPLSRSRLLGRSYAISVLATAAAATILGTGIAIGVAACGVGSLPALAAAGAAAGLLTALAATGVALTVERWTAPGPLTAGWTTAGVVLVALGTVATVRAALHGDPSWLGTVAIWSGPWGWASQLMLRASGSPVPGWPAAAVLTVLVAVLGLAAGRFAPGLPMEGLRRRARSVEQVVNAVGTLDLRQARLSGRASQSDRGLPIRLPRPRSPRWTIAWRDTSFLLRFPARPAAAAVGVATAAVFLCWAEVAPSDGRAVLVLLGWVAFYLAAAQLVEPARLESDDPGRAAPLALGFETIAVLHAVVPLVVLAVFGTVAALIVHAVAGAGAAALLLPSAVTATAAALISAYRGPVPPGLFVGAQSPMGDTSMIQVALWYLRGALLMVGSLTVLSVIAMHVGTGSSAGVLGTPVVIGLLGMLWVRALARKLSRSA